MKKTIKNHEEPVRLNSDSDQPSIEISVRLPFGKLTDSQSKRIAALLQITDSTTRKLFGDSPDRLTVSFESADDPSRRVSLKGGSR